MTGTSGVAFRQAHEAHSEESSAADAACASSVTRAEPLRFGGEAAVVGESALQTLQAAAHALRHASVEMGALEGHLSRVGRQARAAGRGQADAARANRGAQASDAELTAQRRTLGAKREQVSGQAAAVRDKLDALHGAIESIERGLRKTEDEIERLSAQRTQLLSADAHDEHAEKIAGLEGTIEAAKQRIGEADKQLAGDAKELQAAREAPKPALRRQEIRDRLTSMSNPQRSTEDAVDWLRSTLYAALPPAQSSRRGARGGMTQEERIDRDLGQLFARPRPGQPYELRLIEQDPVVALDRVMNLCASLVSTEQYRRIEEVVARQAVDAASQALRGEAPGTSQAGTAQSSLRSRLVARFTTSPHARPANDIIGMLRESHQGAQQERQWGMGNNAVHVGIEALYRGLSANPGWLADAIAAKTKRYGAMLAVDEAEKNALRAGESVPLIEARIAAAQGQKAEAQTAIDGARSELKALQEARAANLSSFTAGRAERLDALDLALQRAHVKLEDALQAQQETVEQHGAYTEQYATHSAKRDRIDTQIAAIDEQLEARRGAFREATREQAQVRERHVDEVAQARTAVNNAWHAVRQEPAIARAISSEALTRVIDRHLGQTSDQMRERLGSVSRTATYRSRADLLRSMADALDDALKRHPALVSAATPADVERLGYLGARAEWLVQHDGVVGHGVRTGRGGQVEHPNAVASSYTLDWSQEGNAGAVKITHLYPWVPRR